MSIHALAWLIFLTVLGGLLGLAVQLLTAFQASAKAKKYPILNLLAELAIQVGNDAIALLRANPTVSPAAALAWAVSELKATAPDAVTQLGGDASDAVLQVMLRRSMITAAQAGTLDDASHKVLADLAPSASTAAVPPPVKADVVATVVSTLPTVEQLVEQVVGQVFARLSIDPATPAHIEPAPAAPAAPIPVTRP
jgi:hypothetical protein